MEIAIAIGLGAWFALSGVFATIAIVKEYKDDKR